MGGRDRSDLPELLDAMRYAADVLRSADVPFVLCGGLAVFARGGQASDHDVDFLIREHDADRALDALARSGARTQRPPHGWLVKAYHGSALVDLIFRPVDRPVTAETLADADILPVDGALVPVLSATELMIHSLLTLSAQECQFADRLAAVQAIGTQIDFDRVRDQTKYSPFARAFLFLAEELDLIRPGVAQHGAGVAHG